MPSETGAANAEMSAWEDPPRVPAGVAADAAPVLSADGFGGPLDWLLELARARKINLAKLSIAGLIESFAEALDVALARPNERAPVLSRWGDWLVMAATLTQLRSRLLLPADAPEAKAALGEAEALRRQMVGRVQMGEAAGWLDRRPQLGQEVFARGAPVARAAGRVGDIAELLRACLAALRVPEAQTAADRPRPPPFWTVSDAIARFQKLLGELLAERAMGAFLPKIGHEEPRRELRCRVAVASTLIASLELARAGALTLEQEEAWTSIQVHCREGRRADDTADQAA